ncbi:MAG: hypothetical protein B9J98_03940 [Candidatus Terraquivivens tikiterensis]|uniref:DUF488 domain-containing protein n=1 Tax=Candidatus Terraquivivens tikiterensis TaxID=1980982 RepID=A0A2R7Y6V2_9ARCH|nr:MAG: hypothetical protein B9J98_03940 [Candidatus Terraquivivens tikiterensis]
MGGRVTIYTIGHGSRSKEAFLNLLRNHGIKVLADVRRWPTSKTEHFKRERLKEWLSEAGIEYVWLGDSLGGYRAGGYEAYTQTERFKEGLMALVELTKRGRVCIMCLEVGPSGCHRRFIAEKLVSMGCDVVHIISEKKWIRVGQP